MQLSVCVRNDVRYLGNWDSDAITESCRSVGPFLSHLGTRTFMGNRGGALHNEAREIVRQYAGRRWITCALEFKGRSRKVMTPGLYTGTLFPRRGGGVCCRPPDPARSAAARVSKLSWTLGG